jgi:hypothetical protein
MILILSKSTSAGVLLSCSFSRSIRALSAFTRPVEPFFASCAFSIFFSYRLIYEAARLGFVAHHRTGGDGAFFESRARPPGCFTAAHLPLGSNPFLAFHHFTLP